MGSKTKREGKSGLSRRDFLKVSAAGAASVGAVTAFDWAASPSVAQAATVAHTYHTTCPYCSASCGQLVDVDADGNVLDVYGDPASPINQGGLCAKGAGSYQLATNLRRLGVPDDPTAPSAYRNPNPTLRYDGAYSDGIAWKRTGNGAWGKMSLDAAMGEIGPTIVSARGTLTSGGFYNSTGVQFFGCSHMNNEGNYLYRRLIAQFGTSQTEHQARI
jgi:formate dehydrogenase major subunit